MEGKSDSNAQNNVRTDEDLELNQPPVETNSAYLGSQEVPGISDDTKKLIINFNCTTSDEVFSEQPPPYSQLTTSISPITYYYKKNQKMMSTIFTPRDFFLISSIIYFIWGSLAFAVTVVLTSISSIISYFGLWSTSLIFNGLINICIVLSQSPNDRDRLKRMFQFTLFLNTIAFLLSAVASNYARSTICPYTLDSPCNNYLTSGLQSALVLVFILTTIHNVFNIVILRKIDNEAILAPIPAAV